MNFYVLILLAGLENLDAIPITPSYIQPALRQVDGGLSRSSRDLIHWNRVTNKFNRYE